MWLLLLSLLLLLLLLVIIVIIITIIIIVIIINIISQIHILSFYDRSSILLPFHQISVTSVQFHLPWVMKIYERSQYYTWSSTDKRNMEFGRNWPLCSYYYRDYRIFSCSPSFQFPSYCTIMITIMVTIMIIIIIRIIIIITIIR